MDLSVLQALEREKVLEVLQRDKVLRAVEDERIRRLKSELQELRRRGAKSFARQYSDRTCARCQRPLGKFWNSGAVCHGCSHRICTKCRVAMAPQGWKCTVCHAFRDIKIKSGEWFHEERGRRFPHDTERHETIGEKLLQSYQRLSNIAVVPPTPPPFYDAQSLSFNSTTGLKKSKLITKSMENLVVSVATHIKKISKSQSDLRAEQVLLTVNDGTGRKSQSDTAISESSSLRKGPSLPNLAKKPMEDEEGSSSSMMLFTDEELSQCSGYSSEKRGSNSSTGTEFGIFDSTRVTGEIELAITYNCRTSYLEITISACKNLMQGDVKKRKCNPYVKVYLLPEKSQSSKMKSSIKQSSTDPVYNETLQCCIERSALATRTLQVSVWHAGALRRKVFLGEVLLPLAAWRFEDRSTQVLSWYTLCPKPEHPKGGAVVQVTGGLQVKLKFTSLSQPSWAYRCTDDICIGPYEVGQLTVLVMGVQNLPSAKPYSSQNTYVKGCLRLPGDRELTQRSPVLRRSVSTESWLQLLFSRVTPQELGGATMRLSLWEHSTFSLTDRPLGNARLEGGPAWQPVLLSPNAWHDLTLPLLSTANLKGTG